MTHERASEKLLDLAYGELSPAEAREVEAHAATCDACRAELAGMRETRALMAMLPAEPAPERGEAILVAAARQAADAARDRRRILPRWLWAGSAGAVAAALVAVVSWQLAKTTPESTFAERKGDLMGFARPVEQAPSAAPAAPPLAPPAAAPAPADDLTAKDSRLAEPRLAKGAPATTLAFGAKAERKEAAPVPTQPAPKAEAAAEPAEQEKAKAIARQAAPPAKPLGALGSGGYGGGAGGAGGWVPVAPAESEGSAGPAPGRARVARDEALADRAEPEMAMAEPAPAPAAAAPPPPVQSAPAAKRAAGAQGSDASAAEAVGLARARGEGRKAAVKADASEPPAAGPMRVEVRTFAGCPGERRRVVERDGEGRVVRYLREGERRTVEHRYAPDGRLAAAFAVEAGARTPLPLDAPGLVRFARDAGMDAPPRCSAP
jgi:hypothetical protein